MNAAEVTFLRAEGALRGWDMGGDAQALYEKAIALSFEERGVTTVSYTHLLNGKVAGVTINTSSSGVGGASRVVMRGTKSIEQSSNCLLYTSRCV